MGIYYYAVDKENKEYFSAPNHFSIKSPGIYHPDNPFPHMLVMKNIQGWEFQIFNDCGNEIPTSNNYKDITDEVYKEYLRVFNISDGRADD